MGHQGIDMYTNDSLNIVDKAIQLVYDWLKRKASGDSVDKKDIFVVTSSYILGNRKLLIGNKVNNLYFELTYNARKDEWYVDVYKKIDNECVKI